MKPVNDELSQIIKYVKKGGKGKNDDFDMDIIQEDSPQKVLNI